MDGNLIFRKYLVLGIVLLFLGTCIIPSTAKPVLCTANTVPHPRNFFGLSSNIEISWDADQTEEPIIPHGEIRSVPLHVLFSVTRGICGRFINYLLMNQPVIVKLSVIDTPEWCTAIISQGTLSVIIPRDENTYCDVWTYLSVIVDDNAPAFELFPVIIQATIEPLHGLLGLFIVMQGTTRVENVTFTVGYKPLLQFVFPQGNIIETPPLVQVELPIGITNLGNGKTIVENEVVNHPDGWTVSLPAQVVLDVDEYKEINLSILAPYEFSDEKSITVSFTPHSFDNYSYVGQTTYASFVVYYRPA
jgi:hypothetical protein